MVEVYSMNSRFNSVDFMDEISEIFKPEKVVVETTKKVDYNGESKQHTF